MRVIHILYQSGERKWRLTVCIVGTSLGMWFIIQSFIRQTKPTVIESSEHTFFKSTSNFLIQEYILIRSSLKGDLLQGVNP